MDGEAVHFDRPVAVAGHHTSMGPTFILRSGFPLPGILYDRSLTGIVDQPRHPLFYCFRTDESIAHPKRFVKGLLFIDSLSMILVSF